MEPPPSRRKAGVLRNKGPAPFGVEPFSFRLATLPLLFHNVSVVPGAAFALRVLKHDPIVRRFPIINTRSNPSFVFFMGDKTIDLLPNPERQRSPTLWRRIFRMILSPQGNLNDKGRAPFRSARDLHGPI